MKYRLTILIVFILSLNLCQITLSQSQPKAWYVYKNATGLNNGTSWQNAWTSFSQIDWSAMQDWDTLYISGGIDSVVYLEPLNISRNRITITNSQSLEHSGKAIISGQGIIIDNKSNVKVSGLFITSNANQGIMIDGSNNITIDKLSILTDSRGIFIQNSIDVTIMNCKITTVNFSTKQTDGIYSQRNRRIRIKNNYIEIRNSEPNGHNDCIQSFEDGISASSSNEETLQIWNNILYQNNNKLSNSSATMLTYGWGWFTLYNNLIIQPNSYTVALGVQQNITPGLSNMKCRIWNNTIIAGSYHDKPIYFRRMSVIDTIDVVNNIVFNEFQYQKIKIDESPDITIKRWNSNSYYSTNPTWNRIALFNNVSYDKPQWQSLNFDSLIFISNPQFINPVNGIDTIGNFALLESSPLIDKGIDLEPEITALGLPWEDILGNPRDNNPDLGAYEHQFNRDSDPPEVVSAQIIDSVTVRVVFSESLEETSANNPNNYAIDNGIIITSVQFSGLVATLSTSVHSPGFYNITVSNVTDTAGNIILSQNNSATYGYNPEPINQLLKFVPGRTNASSIPEPEHRPEKTFDGLGYNSGDPTSRWAGQYLPQWIGYDLNDVRMLSKVRVQFYNWQNGRIYNYSIHVSTDSINWISVKSNVLSQLAEWTEETFEPIPARYIRIIVISNNQNDWASLWEAEFYGQLMVSNNDDQKNIPSDFSLNQNYPNPFNPSTTISWQSPVSGRNTIKLFDMLGREIETIVDDYFEAGYHSTLYIVNSTLPSGVYFYQLRIGDPSTSSGFSTGKGSEQVKQSFIETKKMILLK